MGKYVIFALVAAFVITAIAVKLLIPFLRRIKMGQKILEIGPEWHISKSGTPTMGGLAFIIAILIVLLLFLPLGVDLRLSELLIILLYILLGGAIGAIDDSVKMLKKQNEGISAFSKFLLQLGAASVFIILMRVNGYLSTDIYIPFLGVSIDLGRLYYPFALVFLCGFSNAVNLTDGLDGLCSSVTAIVSVFFAILAIQYADNESLIISLALIGICFGFLIFNFHPAKIFMGDTGSLFLGSAVGALSIVSAKNTVLFLVGIMYLIEAGSVILQVLYYKATKKRLFLMAPIHHHLEKKGMGEISITFLFSAVTALFSLIAFFLA